MMMDKHDQQSVEQQQQQQTGIGLESNNQQDLHQQQQQQQIQSQQQMPQQFGYPGQMLLPMPQFVGMYPNMLQQPQTTTGTGGQQQSQESQGQNGSMNMLSQFPVIKMDPRIQAQFHPTTNNNSQGQNNNDGNCTTQQPQQPPPPQQAFFGTIGVGYGMENQPQFQAFQMLQNRQQQYFQQQHQLQLQLLAAQQQQQAAQVQAQAQQGNKMKPEKELSLQQMEMKIRPEQLQDAKGGLQEGVAYNENTKLWQVYTNTSRGIECIGNFTTQEEAGRAYLISAQPGPVDTILVPGQENLNSLKQISQTRIRRVNNINGEQATLNNNNNATLNSNNKATTATANDGDKKKSKLSKKSKYRGVSWHKRDRRWLARLWNNHQSQYLGSYSSEVCAALAVDVKVIEVRGEDKKRLNFPNTEERNRLLKVFQLLEQGEEKAKRARESAEENDRLQMELKFPSNNPIKRHKKDAISHDIVQHQKILSENSTPTDIGIPTTIVDENEKQQDQTKILPDPISST